MLSLSTQCVYIDMYKNIIIIGAFIAQLSASTILNIENNSSLNIEEIITTYSKYKDQREKEVEQKILKPRVINFINYLYQGAIEMQLKDDNKTIAYTATLSLLANKGKSLELPDKYENLQNIIIEEAKLVVDAKEKRLSPILDVMIDYREFQVPPRYKDSSFYYKIVKFAQIMPLDTNLSLENNITLSMQIEATIKASQRLSNLQDAIYSNLDYLVGIEYKDTNNKKLLLSSKKDINQTAIELDSSYAYDRAIVGLLDNNKTLKNYETSSKNRLALYLPKAYPMKIKKYKPKLTTKSIKKELLNIMIENSLSFALTITNNRKDIEMVKWLKKI